MFCRCSLDFKHLAITMAKGLAILTTERTMERKGGIHEDSKLRRLA